MGRTSALPAPPRPARPPRARGVEAYSKRTASGTTIGYPLYDAHGNNVATLTKDGGSWSIAGTLRAYDAWGNVAGGSALGDPSGRYCANLGHVQDDESGLVYMRARYYEPGTGRFISEDPARDGHNWFSYCDGDPVNFSDQNGQETSPLFRQFVRLFALAGGGAMIANAYFTAFCAADAITPGSLILAYKQSLEAVALIGLAMVYTNGYLSKNLDLGFVLAVAGATFAWLGDSVASAAIAGKGWGKNAVTACFGYSLVIAGFLLADIIENTQ